MRSVVVTLFLVLSVINGRNADPETKEVQAKQKKVRQLDDDSVIICGYEDDKVSTYHDSIGKFATKSFKAVLEESHSGSFVFSPYSVWLSMAALIEGSEDRQNLNEAIGFPDDWCVRKGNYKIILDKEKPSLDVSIYRTRALVIDENVRLKKYWQEYVPAGVMPNLLSAPIKMSPVAAAYAMRQIINVQLQALNLTGNSVFLDSMDYRGLWQTSFPERLERKPFYNFEGVQTGWVDMMRTKMRVKMSYIDELKLKVLELPVGGDGRYRMLLSQSTESITQAKLIGGLTDNILELLKDGFQESRIPIEIQIPRFSLSTELDMRKIMEKFGVNSVWTDPSVTRHISDEPALPSSYIQRVNVILDTAGVNPPPTELPESSAVDPAKRDTGLHPAIGQDFIANSPMNFGLFDSDMYTAHFLGCFTEPTYSL